MGYGGGDGSPCSHVLPRPHLLQSCPALQPSSAAILLAIQLWVSQPRPTRASRRRRSGCRRIRRRLFQSAYGRPSVCRGPPRALDLSRRTLVCAAPVMSRPSPSSTPEPPPSLGLPPRRSGHPCSQSNIPFGFTQLSTPPLTTSPSEASQSPKSARPSTTSCRSMKD